MKCKKFEDLIFANLDGQLAEAEKAGFESHLRACPACSARFEEIRKIGSLVQTAAITVPGADFDKSWRKIAAALSPALPRQIFWLRSPRWLLITAGFLAFFILGVAAARLYFFSARTEMAAPLDAPFMYSAQDYFAALQPVLTEFSNAPGQDGGNTIGQARIRLLLGNLRILRLRADKNRDSSLLRLLDDIELVLLEIAHLDRSDSENTWLIGTLIREKGIPMKMKVFKFADRKTVQI
ncbi:MAG TPA: zf-HC2 domain-containing protein [Patescibacteria group bacterium]|nr:zf-HC2 domain-containing protein [Patescibacteria group bacterium]